MLSKCSFFLFVRLFLAGIVSMQHCQKTSLQCPPDGVATRVNSSWLSYEVCVARSVDEVTTLLHESGLWPECEPLPLLIQGARGNVIDVGAHVGLCAALLCALGHRVISFEADPSNARLLRWTANGCPPPGLIKVYEIGASDQRSVGALFRERQTKNSGSSFVAPAHMWQEYLGDQPELSRVWAQVSINLSRIDAYVRISHGPAIMKLDCQGCELLALRGARRLFVQKQITAVLLEFDPKSMLIRGDQPMEIYYFLKQHGFQIFCLQHVDLFKSSANALDAALAEVARLQALHKQDVHHPSVDEQLFAQQYQKLLNQPGWSPTTLLAMS